MTDYSQLRKGDHIRFTIEGVVHSQSAAFSPYAKTRIVRLAGVGDEHNMTLSWDSQVIDPYFDILDTRLQSGDVAEIRLAYNQEIRRALYVEPKNGAGYWVDAKGTTWNNIKHADIVRFIDRVTP